MPRSNFSTAKAVSTDIRNRLEELVEAYPINHQASYADQIFSLLRDAIVDCILLPGMMFSEASISDVVGISRTPVREAIRRLASERLVDIFPQSGSFVSPVRLSLLREGMFIRSALESANAFDLCTSLTPQQIDEIREIYDRQVSAMRHGMHLELFTLDDSMHAKMFEFSNRDRVWEIIENAKIHLDRVRHMLLNSSVSPHTNRLLTEHAMIIKHMENRDATSLAEIIRFHIEMVEDDLLELKNHADGNFFAE